MIITVMFILHGYLNHGNYGDELLAEIVERRLKKHYPETPFVKLSSKNSFAEHFKLLIVGEDNLDVAALKRLAERPPYGGMMGDSYYPKRVSEDVFNWLFDWLKDQPRDIHRRFMRFVTGSSSLSARTIKVTGPDLSTQGLMPLGHTCFNHISLPFYSDLKQLSEKLEEAIQNANYGGVEQ